MKKVIFGLTALLAACVFFMGCPNTSTSDPTSGNEENTETARKWESAVSSAAAVTDNGDGTFESTFVSKYSGSGFIVWINEDKSSIAAGKTVTVTFDYATDSWKDSTLTPKFCGSLLKDGTSMYSTTSTSGGTIYFDADAATGTITKSFTAESESNQLFVKFNAYKWGGDEETDSIKVTVKSVTVE